MGQKTNPNGFRLITTQKSLSNWYNTKIKYSTLIEEDFLIRTLIEQFFKNILTLSSIEISRINGNQNQEEYININLNALHPRLQEIIQYNLKNCSYNFPKNSLQKYTLLVLKHISKNFLRFIQIKTKKNYNLNITFIQNIFEDAVLIAKYIGKQLENRIPFRRVLKQTIKNVQNTSIKGIKIQISGRLNGNDIARSEWIKEGAVPLHTLKSNINYTSQIAHTIYGIIGIKVWLFIE